MLAFSPFCLRVFSSFMFYYSLFLLFFFFFNDTATTEIYTLSLHDALPISLTIAIVGSAIILFGVVIPPRAGLTMELDRKSTRLNSSHRCISYAVFCLKKKKKKTNNNKTTKKTTPIPHTKAY